MAKKHYCNEKGVGPELYPEKYALLSCNSKTVMRAVISTAHNLRNVSTYVCMYPLFPPHIHLWSQRFSGYSLLSLKPVFLFHKHKAPVQPNTF